MTIADRLDFYVFGNQYRSLPELFVFKDEQLRIERHDMRHRLRAIPELISGGAFSE